MRKGLFYAQTIEEKHAFLQNMGVERGSAEKFFNFQQKDETSPLEIYFTEIIGWWDTDADYFRRRLNQFPDATEIKLFIASPGGFVSDMKVIVNLLKMHPAKVVGYTVGDTASAAAVILCACDESYMMPMSALLHHEAWGGVAGRADDLRNVANALEMETNAIVDMLLPMVEAKGKTEAELRAYMKEDRFLSPKEALAWGFIDGIVDKAPMEVVNVAKVSETMNYWKTFATPEAKKNDVEVEVNLTFTKNEDVREEIKQEVGVLSASEKLKTQFNQLKTKTK